MCVQSAGLVERMGSDSKETEARTIGIKWPWVAHIDAIGSNVMPARTDVTKETEHTRQTVIRCLQSLVHTFSGLNMLTSTDAKAPVLMPVELRLVAQGLTSALRAIRTIQKGLPQAQAHTMCELSCFIVSCPCHRICRLAKFSLCCFTREFSVYMLVHDECRCPQL